MNEMRLDQSHDIYLEGGSIARFGTGSSRSERVGQLALCMMKTEEGEAFTDIEHGIPWFDQVLEIPQSFVDVAAAMIRDKLKAVPGVKSVPNVTVRVDGRNFSGKYTVMAEDGSTATDEF